MRKLLTLVVLLPTALSVAGDRFEPSGKYELRVPTPSATVPAASAAPHIRSIIIRPTLDRKWR